MNNRVIVIGGDHHNTLGVIRGLGERGIYSELILVSSSDMTFVNYSRYVLRFTKVSDDSGIVDVMLSQYKDKVKKPVVICCSDASSGVIDENKDILSPYFILPGANEQGRICALMDKERMAGLAIETGLRVPETTYVKDMSKDLPEIVLPCIIKPIESRKGTKDDIAICNTFEEFVRYAETHNIKNYQIQSFIDKDFEYQLIGCATTDEIIIPGVSKILRPCKGSNTSFLYYTPLEKDFCEIDKYKDFVRRTGYRGLFSLEVLRDKNGNDYFMEINFRNDGNAICVTAAGMSLPFIWYLDCIGSDYSQERNKVIKPVFVMPDMAEFKLLITKQISLKEYLSDFRKTDRFMEYDRIDKKPFWKLVKFRFLRSITRK